MSTIFFVLVTKNEMELFGPGTVHSNDKLSFTEVGAVGHGCWGGLKNEQRKVVKPAQSQDDVFIWARSF